jgi:hypothetical protein
MLTEISALRICVVGWTQIVTSDQRTKIGTVLDGKGYMNQCPLCEISRNEFGGTDCRKCPALGFWSNESKWRLYCSSTENEEALLCTCNEYEHHWVVNGDAKPVLKVLKNALEWWLALKEMNEV